MPRSRWITYCETRLLLRDWADLAGLKPKTLQTRLARGLPLDEALNRPLLDPSSRGILGARKSPWR